MMKIFEVLVEARKNPDLNTKTNLLDNFTKISKTYDTSKLFVSFMNINKKGINVFSKYNTPVGLYCYPFNYVFSLLQKNLISQKARPFPVDNVEYIKVFLLNNDANVMKSDDQLSDHQYQTISKLLDVTDIHSLTDLLQAFRHLKFSFLSNKQKTSILRKLKIDGIIDNGKGLIHPNEPEQAVFLNTTILSTVDVFSEDRKNTLKQMNIQNFSPSNFLNFITQWSNNSTIETEYILKMEKWFEKASRKQQYDLYKNEIISILVQSYARFYDSRMLPIFYAAFIENDNLSGIRDSTKELITKYDPLIEIIKRKNITLFDDFILLNKNSSLDNIIEKLKVYVKSVKIGIMSRDLFKKFIKSIIFWFNNNELKYSITNQYTYFNIATYILKIWNDTRFVETEYKSFLQLINKIPPELQDEHPVSLDIKKML
ncbi:MAG: hypothetical protein KDH96_01105 [Candidatus Riesia sp.]|nr:hypothetical protein [Candidatus Riesia sp.]